MYELLECPYCQIKKSTKKSAQQITQIPKCLLNCLPAVRLRVDWVVARVASRCARDDGLVEGRSAREGAHLLQN